MAIPSSNTANNSKKAILNKPKIETAEQEMKAFQPNVEMILSKVCPAIMFPANRNPKLSPRAKYEINSRTTRRGTKPNGAPEGMKRAKNPIPCR